MICSPVPAPLRRWVDLFGGDVAACTMASWTAGTAAGITEEVTIGAEQTIRMPELRVKVFRCLRSLRGAQDFAAIRSKPGQQHQDPSGHRRRAAGGPG